MIKKIKDIKNKEILKTIEALKKVFYNMTEETVINIKKVKPLKTVYEISIVK